MLLDDFYQETFHAPLVPPDSEETPPAPRGRMHIASVGKRRDTWAGVAIYRAAKKAASHFFIFKSGSERSGLTKKMIHITIKKGRVRENTRREALCRLATFRRPVV